MWQILSFRDDPSQRSSTNRSLHQASISQSREKAYSRRQSLKHAKDEGYLACPSDREYEGGLIDVKSRQSIPRSLKASLEDQLIGRQDRQRSITQP